MIIANIVSKCFAIFGRVIMQTSRSPKVIIYIFNEHLGLRRMYYYFFVYSTVKTQHKKRIHLVTKAKKTSMSRARTTMKMKVIWRLFVKGSVIWGWAIHLMKTFDSWWKKFAKVNCCQYISHSAHPVIDENITSLVYCLY